jgi:polyisoprenoid-binding protein YceI
MRFIAIAPLISVALLAASPARAEPRSFVLDPEHSGFAIQIAHIGYENLIGLFLQSSGSFRFDEATGQMSDLEVAVKSASFFTGHKERDDHVKGPDFLNARQYPEIAYAGKSMERTGERTAVIHGELTIIGVTKPADVAVTINKLAEYPYTPPGKSANPYVMGISARAKFKRSDFGMTYGIDNGLVGDEVSLIMELEADRQ